MEPLLNLFDTMQFLELKIYARKISTWLHNIHFPYHFSAKATEFNSHVGSCQWTVLIEAKGLQKGFHRKRCHMFLHTEYNKASCNFMEREYTFSLRVDKDYGEGEKRRTRPQGLFASVAAPLLSHQPHAC